MLEMNPNPDTGKSIQPLTIKIIGVGGAGSNAVAGMLRSDLAAIPALILHTNSRILNLDTKAQKMILGARRTHGLGTGGDPEIGRAAAEDQESALREFCQGADLIFIVAGLGGGTGTGAAPVVARLAKDSGALALAVVALPFDFEGSRRTKQAQVGLLKLKSAADAVICLPNQKLFQILDEQTPVNETFAASNDLMTQGVRGIWQMLTRDGLINVDFSYLRSVVHDRHTESMFASAEARGEARVREVVERLIASPLLEEGRVLEEASDVLVSLIGGPDLTIAEVNKIMDQLNRRVTEGQLILGAAIDPTLVGCIRLTIVASRPSPDLLPNQIPHHSRLSSTQAIKGDIEAPFFDEPIVSHSQSRFKGPPPATTPENTELLLQQQMGQSHRTRKHAAKRMKQEMFNLEIVSKGRFEKSEPTIHHGEDLDIPTYIRRGVVLN